MKNFKSYAKYYNLFNKNKDYDKEVDFVNSLIIKHLPNTKTILNLGCGTGNHDLLLKKKGYDITGIDQSEEMIKIAKEKKKKIKFIVGDIRNFEINKKFDCIISLFHVMSYQTLDKDLINVFDLVSSHLNDGGIFIFDCWYGPAVLNIKPSVRVKKVKNNDLNIVRKAIPKIISQKNVIDVDYEFIIDEKGHIKRFSEKHSLRYLFEEELNLYSKDLSLIEKGEWLTGKEPNKDTWSVYFVYKK